MDLPGIRDECISLIHGHINRVDARAGADLDWTIEGLDIQYLQAPVPLGNVEVLVVDEDTLDILACESIDFLGV